ncbi:MAG: leucine-rich repeat domain-containing protein [Alkaliphilus sp.]
MRFPQSGIPVALILTLVIVLITGCTSPAPEEHSVGETAVKNLVAEEPVITETARAETANAEDVAGGIHIPDAGLEVAVREALSKSTGTITAADMEELIHLNAAQRFNIVDLTGLEYAINLITLDLRMNQITDIYPLGNLTNLVELVLFGNSITDITPLSRLISLDYLHLGWNQISDFTPLHANIGLNHPDEIWLVNNPATQIKVGEVTALVERINKINLLSTENEQEKTETILTARDYFISEPLTLIFSGGFEDAGYIRSVERIKEGKIQIKKSCTGTDVSKVFAINEEEIILLLTIEGSEGEDFMEESPNRNEIFLQAPLKMGAQWGAEEGVEAIITGIDVEITVPAGVFNTIEVLYRSHDGWSSVRNFAADLGAIRHFSVDFDEEDKAIGIGPFSSELVMILPYRGYHK